MRTVLIVVSLFAFSVAAGSCIGTTIQEQIQPTSQEQIEKISQGE